MIWLIPLAVAAYAFVVFYLAAIFIGWAADLPEPIGFAIWMAGCFLFIALHIVTIYKLSGA